MKALIYVRISPQDEQDEKVSPEAQAAKCRAYCSLYGVDAVEVIEDIGFSGKSLDRPGIQRALEMLRTGQADGIIVQNLDRLSRSIGDWGHLLDHYFSEKAGFTLWSVCDSVDTRSAAGRLVLNVMMSMAQWVRETIVERTTDALRHKIAKGERVGNIPYGWDVGPDGKTLVGNEIEQDWIDCMINLRREGKSFRKIAAILNDSNVPKKNTGKVIGGKVIGSTWTDTDIIKTLKRLERKASA